MFFERFFSAFFVSRVKHNELIMDYHYLLHKYSSVLGTQFSTGNIRKMKAIMDDYEKIQAENKKLKTQAEFTQKELRLLMVLCHPDKHSGSDQATEIFKKIGSLRK